jgi:hypothetical protein
LKVPVQLTTPPVPKAPWWQALQQIYQQVAQVINGKLELGSGVQQAVGSVMPCINFDAVSCSYVTGTAGTDDVITHNLGRIPIGYIVLRRFTAAVIVYDSPTAWTTTKLFLRSTVAGVTVKLLVF